MMATVQTLENIKTTLEKHIGKRVQGTKAKGLFAAVDKVIKNS